jgi:hypothetical protein
MNKKIFNGLEYLKENYKPSEIQKLLNEYLPRGLFLVFFSYFNNFIELI